MPSLVILLIGIISLIFVPPVVQCIECNRCFGVGNCKERSSPLVCDSISTACITIHCNGEHSFSGCSPVYTSSGLEPACQSYKCKPRTIKPTCELCCEDYCNHPGGNISWSGASKKPGCDDSVRSTTKGPDGVSKGSEGGSNGSNSIVGNTMLMMVLLFLAVATKLYSLVTGYEDF